ncbi:acetyl-CoA C-acetyltransferase [Rhizoctonia solani]|uniref:Acetyl-CoA C-acetyltransferase n=1 Tax=Rhizoctonia solani TaxID=456999 RepID=A0A8H8NPB0_9AGAM|nr:acetyl-CoA C-acetyltransferase [Rhizoctonia solani]QRW17404.1 acetyl-CoA C-acetyltransferase [Rhizoctonia solani]
MTANRGLGLHIPTIHHSPPTTTYHGQVSNPCSVPNDVVIVSALRTAITKAKKGGFKDTLPEELLSNVLKAVYTSAKLDPKLIEDVAVGNVLPQAEEPLRHVWPLSTPESPTRARSTPSTGNAAPIDIGIGAGVESMTHGYGAGVMPAQFSEDVLANQESADCLIPMGITSENVAAQYKISRATQDEFAAKSFAKAAAALKAGKFRAEIVPVKTKWTDPKTNEVKEIVVENDDGVRDGVTAESLSKLKPAFSKTGSTHAGNASQVSDGAAAVLLARRSVAQKLGLPILGKFVTSAVIGVPPKIMGVGPAYAIPKALSKAGIQLSDVDFFEINEAFASQAIMSIEHLGIPFEKVNPNGGAIALGHPLGCTGARQVATAFAHAKRTNERIIVTSMCIGSGMGMAAVFVNEQ